MRQPHGPRIWWFGAIKSFDYFYCITLWIDVTSEPARSNNKPNDAWRATYVSRRLGRISEFSEESTC